MNAMKLWGFLLLTIFTNGLNALAIKEIHNEGSALQLNDGSEWAIKYFGGAWRFFGWGWTEQEEVSHWAIGDAIEIHYPDSGNLTDFLLLIKNTSKKEEALAILKKGPSVDYSACLYVVEFNEETNHVTLNNGTLWFRTMTDMYNAGFFYTPPDSLSKWEPGDPLTLIRAGFGLDINIFLLWNHRTNEMPIVNTDPRT